jgi:hypothetical protein
MSRVETIGQVLPMDGLMVRGQKVDARQCFSAFAVSHSNIAFEEGQVACTRDPESAAILRFTSFSKIVHEF